MLKQFYSLMLIAFILASCAQRAPQTPLYSTSSVTTKQYRQVTSFNQIDAHGRINIKVHTGYKQPQVILTGDARDLIQVQTLVKQNTLFIVLNNGYPHYGAVNADIRGQFLNRLHYIGVGSVTGTQLHTSLLDISLSNPGLTKLEGTIGLRQLDVNGSGSTQISGLSSQNLQIHLKGNPKVQLTGLAHITNLDLNGDGWLSLYWVKSNNLMVKAKKGAKIQLAGVVNRLDVELWDTAKFKGRYLRAQRTFVKTHNKSVAQISSVKHQSSLSTDASDVYYYNLPDTRADFMAFDGSVLDMREWDQSDLKDFNPYNKQFP